MAIVIKQDGTQAIIVPANGVNFSQEEILFICNGQGWILVGDDTEMSKENRPQKMEGRQ